VITKAQWHELSAGDFEGLALEHVRDLYPEFSWRGTQASHDGGKDAVGEARAMGAEVAEIYWMEAKHRPGEKSIGQYALDTHLISTFLSRGSVKRLHVVTSGKLSNGFLLRASAFAADSGFVFAYSDIEALQGWLFARPDQVSRFFTTSAQDVLNALAQMDRPRGLLFGRAVFLSEDDILEPSSLPVAGLVPGRKFRLLVAVSAATKPTPAAMPLRLHWHPSTDHVSLLQPANHAEPAAGLLSIDPRDESMVTVPFRLLRYGKDPLPNPVLRTADGTDIELPLHATCMVKRLVSPFVGAKAREHLLQLHSVIRDEVASSRPHLAVCVGRAGSGKSRLADELRDEAQSLGFTVRALEMSATPGAQEERWRQLFRWLLGLEHNPFELSEGQLLSRRLETLSLPEELTDSLLDPLRGFLISGEYSEDLFNPDTAAGRQMATVVFHALARRLTSPVLLHVDDAHHLSRPQMRPLYLLRRLVETHDALPLFVLVTARDDETVMERSVDHFVNGLRLASFSRFHIHELADMQLEDARELVATTLRWPELLAEESRTLDLILQQAGTNPFALVQTLYHLAVDNGGVEFGHGDVDFLVNVENFKTALRVLPKGTDAILRQRFTGLLARGGDKLLHAICAVAIVGRWAPTRVIAASLGAALSASQMTELLALGYVTDATEREVELSHDLLVTALAKRPEAREVARRLAGSDAVGELSDEAQAAVFFAAGGAHYPRSWALSRSIVHRAFECQDYVGLRRPMARLEAIAAATPGQHSVDLDLAWIGAVADQHAGHTKSSLERFEKIREQVFAGSHTSMEGTERYLNATIEMGNQHLLRAELSVAIRHARDALAMLEDPKLKLEPLAHSRLAALAHNRLGAMLHLAGDRQVATLEFTAAAEWAERGGDDYLLAHTWWNLAAMTRHVDAQQSRVHWETAKRLWATGLRDKERLRIMLDCSEQYTDCLASNNPLSRRRLYAVAAEAAERGYLFIACVALLCFAVCAIADRRWDEARRGLLRALDMTAISEDLKNRMFVAHYFSVCAQAQGKTTEALDWCWQASRPLGDLALASAPLAACIRHNYAVAQGHTPPAIPDATLLATGFSMFPFDRA
jgi:hypothetical protein